MNSIPDSSNYQQLLINRELSQLKFNIRVLEQAQDARVPLMERLRFLLIFTSIMDEFFEIRVAGLKRKLELAQDAGTNSMPPAQVLQLISSQTSIQLRKQYQLLNRQLLPQLATHGIHLHQRSDWDSKIASWASSWFTEQVAPLLTPIGLGWQHPFPLLVNKSLNFIIELQGEDDFGRNSGLAIVPVPRNLAQLIEIPQEISGSGGRHFAQLSSLVAANVNAMFHGMRVLGCHPFRLTRNADLSLETDDLHDLPQRLRSGLNARQFGEAVRLEVSGKCPPHIADYLLQQFALQPHELYRLDGPVNLASLQALCQLDGIEQLKFQQFTPSVPIQLKSATDIFSLLREQDRLLYHPYESFGCVLDFLASAASDPDVLAIKQTLYRAGANSEIVGILAQAARNGKEVTVVVELRARFDEEHNLELAHRLEEAGAIVIYGMIGFKTHAKMALVLRRENDGLRRYVHLGTGNYHSTNARLYTDYSLLTSDPQIGCDINHLFDQLTGMGKSQPLQQVLHAPTSLRQKLLALIAGESANATAGKPARIIIKVNALTDPEVIMALYQASQCGVEIRLIVRGMCCLRPGVSGLSENIEVRSIINRQLEHSRVYCFLNYGQQELVYLASADLMERNLDRRIEICFPLNNQQLAHRVRDELQLYLDDNTHAWVLQPDTSYKRSKPATPTSLVDAQQALIKRLCAPAQDLVSK